MPGWLLIKALGKNHIDPIIDLRGMYKRGDVVDVHPPAWIPGNKEVLPDFFRLLVNDKPVPFLAKYFLSDTDPPTNPTIDPTPIIIRRRRYRIEIASLPPPVRNALNNQGEANINWLALRNNIIDKRTGGNEGGVE